jgi:hypothetical protein
LLQVNLERWGTDHGWVTLGNVGASSPKGVPSLKVQP